MKMKGKRILALVLVLVMMASLSGCRKQQQTTEEETETMMIANPVKEFDTLAEAIVDSGTSISLPGVDMDPCRFATIGAIVEVDYQDGKLCIRKAPGNQDISGDYNTYSVNKQLEVNGTYVTVKGNAENAYNCVLWIRKDSSENEFTYAIYSEDGLSEEEVTSWVTGLN